MDLIRPMAVPVAPTRWRADFVDRSTTVADDLEAPTKFSDHAGVGLIGFRDLWVLVARCTAPQRLEALEDRRIEMAGSRENAAVGRVSIARGARAVEAALLDEVCELARTGTRDPAKLALPIRIIVPSRSLREHLSVQLVERSDGAVAGVLIQTLNALVLSILARANEALPGDEALFPVLVRQLARCEPALREPLQPLRDGYGAVEAAVSDLLDAGFEPAHRDAVVELIQELGAGPLAERACAVIRVAAAASEQQATTGVGHRSRLVSRATQLLAAQPQQLLPARAVFAIGFADATGVQTDFIEMLVRQRAARVFIDFPPDPADPDQPDLGCSFAQRFADRLSAACDPKPCAPGFDIEPARIDAIRAVTCEIETREVAERIRATLDAGVRAERIGVVARNFDGYREALRTHFDRLGIPFSGVAETGTLGARGRQLAALFALLHDAGDAAPGRWLEALGSLQGCRDPLTPIEHSDLGLAFLARGISRLADLALTEFPRNTSRGADWRLPARRGLQAADEHGTPIAPKRTISTELSAAAVRAAQALCDYLEDWPTRAPLGEHLERLRAVVIQHLGWLEEDSEMETLCSVLDTLAPHDFVLEREDFVNHLERQIAPKLSDAIGGTGGGVAVLTATEARSRTFETLFLIGLNRNIFPRQISEDPLLRDALRQRLRVVLPDLPVKREGLGEERYLFAQFLSSSSRVVVSHSQESSEGRPRLASPFVERLRGVPRHAARGIWAAESGDPKDRPLRPDHEYALLAGLHGSRDQFRAALELSFAQPVDDGTPHRNPAVLARARVAVLNEADARGGRRGELGPYFGFVGELREKADLRRAPLFVTVAEKIAACPWQVFITRLLGIEALPSSHAELPSTDPRIVSSLVHSVLHEIVAAEVGADFGDEPEDLEDVIARQPISVAWPESDRLREILLRCAERLLRVEGITTPGFARVLVEAARGHLEVARTLDWPGPGSGAGVLGAEVEGAIRVSDCDGADRELRFRADRIDRVGDTLRFIDYKGGKPLSTLKKEDSRKRAFLKEVSRGASLQAISYALAGARGRPEAAMGEYRFLKPDLPDDVRVAAVAADDAEFVDAFTKSTQAVLTAWDRGSFFPRLFEGKAATEPSRCQRCEVKEACLRGDSGARRRLQRWIESPRSDAKEKLSAAEGALVELWFSGEGTS